MIGKFSSEQELLRSYESLEKEFTKKCQELGRLKKEQEAQDTNSKDLLEKVDNLDSVCATSEAEAGEDKKTYPPAKVEEFANLASALNKEEKAEKGEHFYDRAQALELLLSRPDAKNYSREIAKELIINKSLQSAENPFFMAYLIVKDRMGENEKTKENSIKSEEKQQKTETKLDKLSALQNDGDIFSSFPALLKGTKSDGVGVPYRKKYTSLEDARGDLINRYFS